MMNYFLKAKHWQLFLLMFGLPFFLQGMMMRQVISSIPVGGDLSPYIDMGLNFLLALLLFSIVLFWGWLWSVGVGIQAFIPSELRLNVKQFKVFLIIPFIHILFFLGMIIYALNLDETLFNENILFFISFGHLFSMYCILYCIYFIAKTIKTAELQQKVTFGDILGTLFLLFIYQLGIWSIQPRINKLIQQQKHHTSKKSFEILDDELF